jgi:hypothetical protein
LIPCIVITDARTHRVRAMTVIITGRWQTETTTGISTAVNVIMHRIPPIVIVICARAIPATIVRL